MALNPLLLPASFRGIPFRIKAADTTFGRRNQLHEYPMRDTPYSEDLGKKAREYTMDAYVIGAGYEATRTLLINAIEKNKTPGQLIHPKLGIKTVTPRPCRHRFSNEEGGIEYLELTFVEAGENLYPDILSDTIGLVNESRTDGLKATVTQFGKSFTISHAPEFVRSAAAKVATSASTSAMSAVSVGVVEPEKYANYIEANEKFTANLNTEMQDPEGFGNDISGLVTGLTELYAEPMDAYESQKTLLSFGDDFIPVPILTPNRKLQAVISSPL